MSHLSTLATSIAHLGLAKLAAEALGIPVHEGPHLQVKHFYGGDRKTPVEMAFGQAAADYRMGLRKPEGAEHYELVGDVWGVGTTAAGKEMLERFGTGFSEWEWVNNGHQAKNTPSSFLMEYVLQTGLYVAQCMGMTATRLASDQEAAALPLSTQNLLGNAQPGAQKMLLRGGPLPGHMTMILIANPDGTSSVAFDGATDQSCYQFTKPLEDALGGVMLADFTTLDTAHTGVQNRHVARQQ